MKNDQLKRRLAAAAACGLALTAAAAAPASAAAAQHDVFVENSDSSYHLTAAENPCGPWGVTVHAVRSGSYKIVFPVDGGEIHTNGAVDGVIELIPEDPTRPTYTGTFREKANAVVTEVSGDGENDVFRINQSRLRSALRGTDGSQLVLRFSAKLTVNANGRVVVSHNLISCQ